MVCSWSAYGRNAYTAADIAARTDRAGDSHITLFQSLPFPITTFIQWFCRTICTAEAIDIPTVRKIGMLRIGVREKCSSITVIVDEISASAFSTFIVEITCVADCCFVLAIVRTIKHPITIRIKLSSNQNDNDIVQGDRADLHRDCSRREEPLLTRTDQIGSRRNILEEECTSGVRSDRALLPEEHLSALNSWTITSPFLNIPSDILIASRSWGTGDALLAQRSIGKSPIVGCATEFTLCNIRTATSTGFAHCFRTAFLRSRTSRQTTTAHRIAHFRSVLRIDEDRRKILGEWGRILETRAAEECTAGIAIRPFVCCWTCTAAAEVTGIDLGARHTEESSCRTF